MKNVFIKYNPYNLETTVLVDEKKPAQNSQLGERVLPGSRLQEWVEELPHILIEEYNDTEFDVVFHGTLLDFEDLTEVFTHAYEQGKLTAKLERIPAKETSDKEALIDEVFAEIQEGPFDELRDKEIINAFQHAKSKDFEVCVVATMSAGKSTLINALLGTKLMPSKQEACTAIITRIKDTEGVSSWEASVYDKDNRIIETRGKLMYSDMERLNGDERVSMIKIAGNIPFVSSEDVSLVLIDTPGPNNSRDPEHRKVQSEFLNKSSKSLVLYIMEGTFGSDDDNSLLQRVSDSMKVGGKQSKDRFIFVVNKMDDRRKEDGDTRQTLSRIHAYLKNHGITNPNLFPAAALPALNIRLIQGCEEIDEDTLDETELKVRKLNRNETLHLESYASLPTSICEGIKDQLNEAKERNDVNAEALIHTGIPSVEAAIRQYVQKYAKTAKIKNIVDTFMHKLDEIGCFEKLKQELVNSQGERETIANQIFEIREKINDTESAKQFKNAVENAVIEVERDAKNTINGMIQKYQARLTERIDSVRGEELEMSDVDREVESLSLFAKKLEPDFEADLEELIRENLIKTSNVLLEEYRGKLRTLTEEIAPNALSGIVIDPIRLMGGSLSNVDDFSVQKLIRQKKVKDGEEWVANTERRWYKPWTWFQEKGYYRTKYKQVKYVQTDELAQEFFSPIQENLYENADAAYQYVGNQSRHIKESFNEEFQRLDDILKRKLSELEMFVSESEKVEEQIKEMEERLQWLEKIEQKVVSILEI